MNVHGAPDLQGVKWTHLSPGPLIEGRRHIPYGSRYEAFSRIAENCSVNYRHFCVAIDLRDRWVDIECSSGRDAHLQHRLLRH